MAERQSFYVGVKGIIQNGDGDVLILRDAGRGKWEVPGGRIDENQSIIDSFTREIEEELQGSTFVELGKLIHAAQGDFLIENKHRLMLLFYKAKVALPKRIILSDEHSEYGWVNSGNIENYDIFSTDKAAILAAFA